MEQNAINKRIRELRERAGIDATKLAKTLNIPYQSYVGYERSTEPKIHTLCKLADYYGMTLDELTEHNTSDLDKCIQLARQAGYKADTEPTGAGYIELTADKPIFDNLKAVPVSITDFTNAIRGATMPDLDRIAAALARLHQAAAISFLNSSIEREIDLYYRIKDLIESAPELDREKKKDCLAFLMALTEHIKEKQDKIGNMQTAAQKPIKKRPST